MSMLKKKLALGLAPLLLSCGVAHAAKGNVVGNPEGLYLGAYGFYYIFDNNWEPTHPADPDDELGGGFALGYQFNQWIGAELFYERFDTEFDVPGLNDKLDPRGEFQHIGAAVNFFLQGGVDNPNADGFNPYVTALVMHQNVDIEGSGNNDIDSFLVGAGLGAQWSFTNNLSARIFGRVLWNTDEDNIDYQVGAGAYYYFGGVPQPAAVETPMDQPAPAECTPQSTTINLDVKFDFDKSFVKPEFYPEIQRLADFMKQNPEAVLLIGHTDSIGTDAYNQKLSERRANAVRDVMIKEFGIEASRITTEGRGESQPIAENRINGRDNPEGRALNRRVEGHIEVTVDNCNNNAPATEEAAPAEENSSEEAPM